jgi:hypothetical protein
VALGISAVAMVLLGLVVAFAAAMLAEGGRRMAAWLPRKYPAAAPDRGGPDASP